MTTPLSPSTLYSSLAAISPQDYTPLPKSPSELTPFLTTTIEAARHAVSSIPAHPSATNASPENHDIKNHYKSVKLPTTPPPPGNMKLWKLSAKDGKGVWFARRSVHENIGFERFRRGLDVEFSLGENGLEGTERQEIPGGGVDSVRGIGCVERVGGKIVERGGEVGAMEIFRLAAQFPGPTAAREFVTVCCKKQGREKGGGGRWYMIVSRPVKVGEEIEGICPGKGGEGYVRGEYESVELIREVVPEEGVEGLSEVEEYTADEGENLNSDYEIVEEVVVGGDLGKEKRKRHRKKKHKRHHKRHQEKQDAPVDAPGSLPIAEDTPTSTLATPASVFKSPSGPKEARNYPIEWVMISRSDPGGNVPRWMVERATPCNIVKDAEKFLKWLGELSDEQLGLNNLWGSDETLDRKQEVAVSLLDEGSVVKEEKDGSQETTSNLFEMVSPISPTGMLPNIPSILGGSANTTNNSSSVMPQQRPSPPTRSSSDTVSLQSFSTAAQHPITLHLPLLTPSSASAEPPLTPLTTSPTISATAAPPLPPSSISDTESKSSFRLLSQKTRLVARLDKALQKIRKGEGAEAKLRQRYEEEVRREEAGYKRDMEKLGQWKEREAQKQKEKEQKEREKEKRGVSSSNASQTVREAREVVERLTRENEMLVRENEELRRKVSVLEAEAGHS